MQELAKILEEIDHEKDLSLKLGDDGCKAVPWAKFCDECGQRLDWSGENDAVQ